MIDLIILMLDASNLIDEEDLKIINSIKNKKYIVLLNKIDLDKKIEDSNFNDIDSNNIIEISAKSGKGISKLKAKITELFFNGEIIKNDVIITNIRHKEALIRARVSCISAIEALKNTAAIDLASIDLRNAWHSLGEITGDTVEEDLIDKIFRDFCLGK